MQGIQFRLGGIPVLVQPAFIILALLIGFISHEGSVLSILLTLSVFVSVLVHELGHAVAFRSFGRQPAIVLHGLGGRTAAPGELTRGRDLIVTIAGSGSQIVFLGLPAWWLRTRVESLTLSDALTDLAFVSLAWGVLNLVPVIPLDGGRIAARLLEAITKNGLRLAHMLSVVVAAGGGVWGFVEAEPFLGFAGVMLAGTNLRALQEMRQVPQQERIRAGHAAIDAGDHETALRIANESGSVRSPAVRNLAAELAAWAHLARGDRVAAEAALAQRKQGTERSGYLSGFVALDAGDREAATVILARAYQTERPLPPNRLLATRLARDGLLDELVGALLATREIAAAGGVAALANALHDTGMFDESVRLNRMLYDTGLDPAGSSYNLACGLARLGDEASALAWLERAIYHGFDNAALLDQDPDLGVLRETAQFGDLRSQVAREAQP